MSTDENKVILEGRVGSRTFKKENVVELSIATETSYTDRSTKEKVVNTEWTDVAFFDKQCEIIKNLNIDKGSAVRIEAKLKKQKWKDNQGKNQEKLGVIGKKIRKYYVIKSENTQDINHSAQISNQNIPVNPDQQQAQGYVQANPQNVGQPVQGQVQQVNNGGYGQY